MRGTLGVEGEIVERVVLGVSEVVTNAVVHARTEITVTVRHLPQTIRVEVHDLDPRVPRTRNVPVDAESGRGLSLVEALGLRWGVQPQVPGKTVWIEADL